MYIPDIVRKLAELKKIHEEEMRLAILSNAKRVFGI
jgi:Tat protein secretion system quality control protein TatD with DNase activity